VAAWPWSIFLANFVLQILVPGHYFALIHPFNHPIGRVFAQLIAVANRYPA
jgi:hypothetical protein